MFRRKNKEQEQPTANHDGTDNAEGGKKKSKFYQRFAQQQLWGWSPIITGNVVVIYFLLVAVVCIALGVPILVAAINVKEVKARYDNAGPMSGLSSGQAETTILGGNVNYPVSVQIPQTMQPPVYVYYELGKYYQNHKRYVRSRDDNQMAGKSSGAGSGKCAPEQYIGGNPDPSLPAQGAVTPCGLIAWSLFNDSFGDAASVAGPGGVQTPVTLDQGHIAWQYDVDHLYGPVQPVNYNTEQEAAFRGGNTSEVVLNQNQHFIVWMRPAAQPTFRKLWAVIDVPLLAGTVLTFNIQNNYNTYRFGGHKTLVISTNSWMGGKNLFLGVCYLVIAGLALIVSIAFLFTYHLGCFGMVKRRKFGDVSQLSWNCNIAHR
ncbi:g11575 [Coccomyxa viridis]|uniref:ALA-interacting subunit n=1 Tax=Coccomyxa viridis TaxID=1274662 RepID=A0ABP1G884_9CHLO